MYILQGHLEPYALLTLFARRKENIYGIPLKRLPFSPLPSIQIPRCCFSPSSPIVLCQTHPQECRLPSAGRIRYSVFTQVNKGNPRGLRTHTSLARASDVFLFSFLIYTNDVKVSCYGLSRSCSIEFPLPPVET